LSATTVFQNRVSATNKKGKSSQVPGLMFRVRAMDRLLEAATALFAERGYSSTYVREIVTGAGMTKPVLTLSA